MVKLRVQVELLENFSVVKETLERVGVRNRDEKKFFPSCYIIQEDDDTYCIYHFKELFAREGKETTYNDVDELRRNTIAFLLQNWNLVKIVDELGDIQVKKIDVLNYGEKKDYRICHKYLFKRSVE